MKKRILKILIPVFIIIFAAVYGLNSKLPSTAFAVGDLTIDWGVPSGDPIFVISNFLPGDMEEEEVDVTNNASSPRPIGVRGIQTSESQNFSEGLMIEIFDGITSIYGPKTLTQFFSESSGPTGIPLSTLAPSAGTTYKFKVTFESSSGNKYQGAEIVFDIKIGISIDLPAECDLITFAGDPIFGTSGNDNINGNSSNNLIITFEGNDNVLSGGGKDCIVLGEGNDSADGGTGNDVIDAGGGDDRVSASSDQDVVYGGAGNDNLTGGSSNDKVFGQGGNDNIEGGSGNDLLIGGDGVDFAKGGTGTDTCDAETETTCELNP